MLPPRHLPANLHSAAKDSRLGKTPYENFGQTFSASTVIQMPRSKTSRGETRSPERKSRSSSVSSPQIRSAPATHTGLDPASVRIVVVDDHPLFRHGLVQLLNSEPSFAVCGEASSAPEAMSV